MHHARPGLSTAFQEGELPTLHGSQVILRWLTADDVDALHEIFSDPEVARYLAIPRQPSREQRLSALLERLGFRREGYLRERYLKDGEIQDSVIFGLLRSDAREASSTSSSSDR